MENLTTDRLILRIPRIEDAEHIEFYASDYDIAKTTLNIPHPYPKGSARAFVEHQLEKQKEGVIVPFVIEEKIERSFIGLIAINITAQFNQGELGYWIGKPFWGKGYGTEAAERVVRFGFEQLELHKIFARALAHNPGSWRIMEKIGMAYEGKLREHVKKADEYYDIVFYGMLKREFGSKR